MIVIRYTSKYTKRKKTYEKVERLDLDFEELYEEYYSLYHDTKNRHQYSINFVTFEEFRKIKRGDKVIKKSFEANGQRVFLEFN